jgi:hypothetical protein
MKVEEKEGIKSSLAKQLRVGHSLSLENPSLEFGRGSVWEGRHERSLESANCRRWHALECVV